MSTGFEHHKSFQRPESIEHLAVTALGLISSLRRSAQAGRATEHQFDSVRATLGGLPLASPEFALANRRLNNAVRYYGKGELAAAAYELRLLRGGLAREVESVWGI